MTNKRALNAEEKAIAKRLKAIIAADPNLTEESVGVQVGVSQGQVSHWTGGRLPVPAARAAALAKAVGIENPGEISLAYRRINTSSGVKEAAHTYSAPSEHALGDLQAEVASLKAVLAILLTVGVAHRPIEGADLSRRLRKHLPAKMLQHGFVHEIVKTLDKAHDSPAAAGPYQAGSSGR